MTRIPDCIARKRAATLALVTLVAALPACSWFKGDDEKPETPVKPPPAV